MNTLSSILSDLWSIQLSVIGIAVSVMTLLYASHVGKAEAYQHIKRRKNINDEFLSIYLSNGIDSYKKLNGKIVRILIVSCVLFIFTMVVKYVTHENTLLWLGIADMLLSVALVVWIVCVMVGVFKQYKQETK